MTPNQTLRANTGVDDLNSLAAQEAAQRHLMNARMQARKGEREAAYGEIKRAFAAHPGDRGAIEMLGDFYLEDGETEKALALYQRALKAHPDYAPFEEKLAICRLDLAEIEADRAAKSSGDPLALLQAQAQLNQGHELAPHKAVSLSLFLPGAGQFYNDEIEKGALFLGAALICFAGWFYPIWTAAKAQKWSFGTAFSSLHGGWSVLFWLALVAWIAVYLGSMIDAGQTAAALNNGRRKALGL